MYHSGVLLALVLVSVTLEISFRGAAGTLAHMLEVGIHIAACCVRMRYVADTVGETCAARTGI